MALSRRNATLFLRLLLLRLLLSPFSSILDLIEFLL